MIHSAGVGSPEYHINIRILQTMISGITLLLGLGTRISDPYVYEAFWAPRCEWETGYKEGHLSSLHRDWD